MLKGIGGEEENLTSTAPTPKPKGKLKIKKELRRKKKKELTEQMDTWKGQSVIEGPAKAEVEVVLAQVKAEENKA